MWDSPFLKEFELLAWRIRYLWLSAKKEFNIGELFVGYAHNTNFTKLR